MPNYSYIVDSHFQPFSFDEMLKPVAIYTNAYEKRENAYQDLADKTDTFKYLAKVAEENPNSEAGKIYQKYTSDMNNAFADFSKNGLSVNNSRDFLNLKRRYQGEIGLLAKADEALQKERNRRLQINIKDGSMLYATDDLSIDDFLGNTTPNLYNISGNELYARGSAAGKSASSRVYNAGDEGSTLGGYYRKWVERNGYSKESIDAFRQNASTIPELQQAANAILAERGVNENLSGINLERAKQSVLNGIIDGAVYAESIKPVEDRGKISAGQAAQIAMQRESMQKNAAMNGLTWNPTTKSWDYDPNKDPSLQRAATIAEIKAKAAKNNPTSGRSGAAYDSRNKSITMVGSKTGNVYKEDGTDGKGTRLDEVPMRALSSSEYSQLVDANGNITNEYLRSAIGNGQLSDYEIYVIPSGSTELTGTGWLDNDDLDEDVYVAIPRDSKRAATEFEGGSSNVINIDGGTNDIPE